ncbi:hypothetical protein GF312_10570 [Candidatus Poribacteria bacterium]|nr:hypothetical protein [Candidatus Poribacteria bacterium]
MLNNYRGKGVKVMKKVTITIAIIAVLTTSFLLFFNRNGAFAKESDATYVPGKKCRVCHIKIYKAQDKTPHANSYENLVDAGEETNEACLPCHVTGYGQPGGFEDAKSSKGLAGTTCQACHGPGSKHVEKGLSKEQRKETIQKTPKDACTKCHKTHEPHPDIGVKSLPSLKKEMERLQERINELEG